MTDILLKKLKDKKLGYNILMFLINLVFIFKLSYAVNVLTMPGNCTALLPDMPPYINFFNEIGSFWIDANPKMSEKVFKLLALGNMYSYESKKTENNVFNIIKENLCVCFFQNNQQTFTANSVVVREFLQKNIDNMIKLAKDELINIRTTNYLEQMSNLKLKQNSKAVEEMQLKAYNAVSEELNKTFNKKIKKN